jgi:coenzyme F420-reducing hydrogenase delta subunit
MVNLSSAMGGQFVTSTAEMAAEIEELGPNPLRLNGHEVGKTDSEK